jgi:hypothetical protein
LEGRVTTFYVFTVYGDPLGTLDSGNEYDALSLARQMWSPTPVIALPPDVANYEEKIVSLVVQDLADTKGHGV